VFKAEATKMSLILHYHPLASFCWKVLIALYENDTPFESVVVDLGEEKSRAAFLKLWPHGKFPVLQDTSRDRLVPESSIIIDYLDAYYPGSVTFIPGDRDLARQTRLADSFYDSYVHEPMQKIVTDKIRPVGNHDPFGVEQARQALATSYPMIDQDMRTKQWAMGDAFTLADCAAFPALYYANKVAPFVGEYEHAARYLARLTARPSVARVLKEAQPYMPMFPYYKPGEA
jgi:glutathione S-transferase